MQPGHKQGRAQSKLNLELCGLIPNKVLLPVVVVVVVVVVVNVCRCVVLSYLVGFDQKVRSEDSISVCGKTIIISIATIGSTYFAAFK